MPPVISATRPFPLPLAAAMFLVSFVAMSLRLRRRPRAIGQARHWRSCAHRCASLLGKTPDAAMSRRRVRAMPVHATSALSCRPCRKSKKRPGVPASERGGRWHSPPRCSPPGRSPAGRRAHPADAPARLAPVVVTATRTEESPFDAAGVDRPHRRRDDPRRPPAGQHLREPRRRPRAARARPPELRAGRADLGARLRRPLDLRHPRRSPLRRRHPGDPARRPGPDHQRRPRLGRQHRGPARAVLGALRQLLGRRHPGVHRRGQRPADRRRRRLRRQLRRAALRPEGERRHRRLRLRRQRQHLPHRRLPRAQRGRAQHRQRQAHLARRRQPRDASSSTASPCRRRRIRSA